MEKGDAVNPASASSSSSAQIKAKVEELKSGESSARSFSLGGIGAVSRSVGVLGRDTDSSMPPSLGRDTDSSMPPSLGRDTDSSMPPSSQKRTTPTSRTTTYQGSEQCEVAQSDRGVIRPGRGHSVHFQPARRTNTFTSHPPLGSAALQTVQSQRKARNSTSTMDHMPSTENFSALDLKSAFNPSPISLYMYDQDHQDASKVLFTPVCTSSREFTPVPVAGDCESDPLHPQFENSNNLEGFFRGVLGAGGIARATTHSGSGVGFESVLFKQELATISQEDFDKLQPELSGVTEVNVDPYLFEDSDSMARSQGGELQPSSTMSPHQKMVVDAEKETSAQIHPELGPKTFTPLKTVRTGQSPAAIVQMMQSQSSPCHTSTTSFSTLLTTSRTRNVTAVSPVPTTTSVIKTEPAETGDSTPVDSNPCIHKILHSPSRQSPAPHVRSPTSQPPTMGSGALMPSAAGQSRTPSLGRQGKSGSVEEKWREIEKFIHDPSTDQPQLPVSATLDRKRKRHGSGESTAMSDDESVNSQHMGSITDDDSDSDDDSDVSDTPFEESLTELAKKSKQYFWQYNIQAKGPKGTRLHLSVNDNDPHHPSHFEDPVFDPSNTNLVGIRHAGKARKGDGNEISPNPRKLYMIGQKLCRLNREINNVQLVGSLSASERSKSRKEKNKLSSRACRLKKKAQHEANKIKLFGLNCEQGELLEVVRLIWPKLKEQAKQQMKENIPFTSSTLALQINSLINTHHKTKTAGSTANYVNQAVARVEDGNPTGGLAIKLKPVKVK